MPLKLFMLLLGCTPPGRNTEQHDVYFTISTSIRDTVPEIINFWPEANGRIHIDAWREITTIDNYKVEIALRDTKNKTAEIQERKLFFINLGGYKENEFDEFHYKLVVPALDKSSAILNAKQTAFYKHTRFKGAESHIDDKFGIDVDDIFEVDEILPVDIKHKYSIRLLAINAVSDEEAEPDELHLGYFKLNNL